MMQINDNYYEDLDKETLKILDKILKDEMPNQALTEEELVMNLKTIEKPYWI